MRALPANLRAAFLEEMKRMGLDVGQRASWLKWARFYVDFGLKYGHPPRATATLPLFLEKLAKKKQDAERRQEAREAVTLLCAVMNRFRKAPPGKAITPAPVGGEKGGPKSRATEAKGGNRHTRTSDASRGEGRAPKASVTAADRRATGSGTPEVNVSGRDQVLDDAAGGGDRTKGREDTPNRASGASWGREYSMLRDALAVGQYALATRKTYTHWIRQFQGYLRSAEPGAITSKDAAGFLTHLARDKQVTASTQNQAFNALLFFFRQVLNREFQPEGVKRAKRTRYVPQTLTREEIMKITDAMPAPYSLVGQLLYGCGLRLTEALTLRVHNFDFDLKILTIHRGKGQKDRTVPLPAVLIADLQEHLQGVKETYESDLKAGFTGAFMPLRGSPARWNQRARKWEWQFFFPAKRLTQVSGADELRRYHLHANDFGVHLREAVDRLGTHKKVSAHTFRHSFASHLLLANYDIKTIQEMLGHSDVRTTMIYVQTVPSRTCKERKSPLDFPHDS